MFFFNDPATSEIYTLSQHDALPTYAVCGEPPRPGGPERREPGPSLHLLAQRGRHARRLQRRELAPLLMRVSGQLRRDRKSTRLNSSHANISYAVFCLKKQTFGNCSS